MSGAFPIWETPRKRGAKKRKHRPSYPHRLGKAAVGYAEAYRTAYVAHEGTGGVRELMVG